MLTKTSGARSGKVVRILVEGRETGTPRLVVRVVPTVSIASFRPKVEVPSLLSKPLTVSKMVDLVSAAPGCLIGVRNVKPRAQRVRLATGLTYGRRTTNHSIPSSSDNTRSRYLVLEHIRYLIVDTTSRDHTADRYLVLLIRTGKLVGRG